MKPIFILILLALVISTFASPVPAPEEHVHDDYDYNYWYNNQKLRITSPLGKVTWDVTSTQQVTFTSNELPYSFVVKVSLSYDSGDVAVVINPSVTVGTGVVTFNVPQYLAGKTLYILIEGEHLKLRGGPVVIRAVGGPHNYMAETYDVQPDEGHEHQDPNEVKPENRRPDNDQPDNHEHEHNHDNDHDNDDWKSKYYEEARIANPLHITSPIASSVWASKSWQSITWWTDWQYSKEAAEETFTIILIEVDDEKGSNPRKHSNIAVAKVVGVSGIHNYQVPYVDHEGYFVIVFVGKTFYGHTPAFKIRG